MSKRGKEHIGAVESRSHQSSGSPDLLQSSFVVALSQTNRSQPRARSFSSVTVDVSVTVILGAAARRRAHGP